MYSILYEMKINCHFLLSKIWHSNNFWCDSYISQLGYLPLLLILVFRVGPADYSYMSVYYITCNQLPLISMFLFVTSVCTLYVHVCIRYSTIETKEAARIGYNRFLFPHEYSGEGRGALYPIRANSFVSIIMYLTCTIIVLLKK